MSTARIARSLTITFALLASCLTLVACMGGAGYGDQTSGGPSLADRVASGLSIRAERGSKTLEIERMSPGKTRPANLQKDTWTVFVYLCGSDLESQGGSATADLNEMIRASGSSNVRFVVETGGAKTWRNKTVDARKLGRFVVQNGKIMDADSVKAASMGKASTLADFLAWGISAYPADHMGLILWDHGGGSITGACFDERNNNDSLYLRELDEALSAAYARMWDKFDFIGFDACLMSTLETANVLATYADTMVASQESEPATGWDYRSVGEYLAKHPSCDGQELGRAICDGYQASVDRSVRGFSTLSVVDLSQIDQLMQDFYRFSQEMYASSEDQGTLAAMTRGIQQAENFGCNNRREGYTNMVDLGGIVTACADVTPSAVDVLKTLDKAVTYEVHGTYHAAATGLSTYYPLKLNASQELTIFETVAVNPSYLSYVDRVAHGAAYNGGSQYQSYTNDTFYADDFWSWLFGSAQETQQQAQEHWSYVDEHTDTSTQISFADKPQVDDEGTFWFRFDRHGIDNASVVSGLVYEFAEDGSDLISLGETYDVYGDWETGEFADGFDGRWLSLPDGQSLSLAVDSATEEYVIFSSPIVLNGKDCFLRLRQSLSDGSVEVEGAWNALESSGAMDRGMRAITSGDVIVPRYEALSVDAQQVASRYEGESYTVGNKGLAIDYGHLPDGAYEYRFCIQDAFGDAYISDAARFEVDPSGKIYFT